MASKETPIAGNTISSHLRRTATLHLIYGFAGAGKTTFAKRLGAELSAIRFSPDEWMVALYGTNPPREHFQEFQARISRLIWDQTIQLLHQGVDVILDTGFWSRASRDDARARAKAIGAPWKLYFLDCSEDVMRRRVLNRTDELPTGALVIDEAAFESFKRRFEPLGPDEDHVRIQTG